MKTKIAFLFLFLTSAVIYSQSAFTLKMPDVKKIQHIINTSDTDVDVIYLFFENNYNINSKKTNIKLDPDFGGIECGFTKKYKHGIVFISQNCGEASPMTQTISFPKTKLAHLKKWIEQIHKAGLRENSKEIYEWYKGKNEFGPKGGDQAGCYYKIKQTKNKSIVEVWCGC